MHSDHARKAHQRRQTPSRVQRQVRQSFSSVPPLAVLVIALGIAACSHLTSPDNPGVTLAPGTYLLTGIDWQELPAWTPSCLGCSDSLRVLPDTFWLGTTGGFKWQLSFEGEPLTRIPTLFQGSVMGNGVSSPSLVADGASPVGGAATIGHVISAVPDSFVVQSFLIVVLGAPHVFGFHRRD